MRYFQLIQAICSFSILAILFSACKNHESDPGATLYINNVEDVFVGDTNITLSATYYLKGSISVEEFGFIYKTSSKGIDDKNFTVDASSKITAQIIESNDFASKAIIPASESYHYFRAYLITNIGIIYSETETHRVSESGILKINPPVLDDNSPVELTLSQSVMQEEDIEIYLNNSLVSYTKQAGNILSFTSGEVNKHPLLNTLTIKAGESVIEKQLSSNRLLKLSEYDNYNRIKDLDIIVSDNNNIYFGYSNYETSVAYSNRFYIYRTDRNSWGQLPNFPTDFSHYKIGFSINGTAYFGDPLYLYNYNTSLNKWEPVKDEAKPTDLNYWPNFTWFGGYGAADDHNYYIMDHFVDSANCYVFKSSTNSWYYLPDYPVKDEIGSWGNEVFILGNNLYVLSNRTLQKYDINAQEWNTERTIGFEMFKLKSSFIFKDKAYVLSMACDPYMDGACFEADYQVLWLYDEESNEFVPEYNYVPKYAKFTTFSIGDKVFFLENDEQNEKFIVYEFLM